MVTKVELIKFMLNKYQLELDYLFKKYPKYGVYKHQNGKWFALIMTLPKNKITGEGKEEITVVTVKVRPELNEILQQSSFCYPAYHMNKKHWLTINIEELTDFEFLTDLIEESYNLTLKEN